MSDFDNTPLIEPENKLRINELYAFISQDDNGNEGVCAFNNGETFMPLIGADKERIESLRNVAMAISRRTNQKILLVKFTNRENIEEV